MARNMSIVYGSTTIGGASTDYLLHDLHELVVDYDNGRVKASVVCVGTSAADFAANCTALETAFRTPRQRLRVIMFSEDLADWDPATAKNTGFSAEPSIRKPGSAQWDGPRSRLYEIEVIVDRPADLSGQSGRRDSTVKVTTGESGQLILEVIGAYSAIAGTDATDTYEAAIDIYVSALETAIGGSRTWESLERSYSASDDDKRLTFVVRRQEVIEDKTLSGKSSAVITNPRLAIVYRQQSPGDSLSNTDRPIDAVVVYHATIAVGQNLRNVWATQVRPYAISRGLELASASGQVALLEEAPSLEPTSQHLRATMILRIYTGPLVESSITVRLADRLGKTIDEVWDGNDYAALVRPGSAAYWRFTRIRRLELGGGGGSRRNPTGGSIFGGSGGGGSGRGKLPLPSTGSGGGGRGIVVTNDPEASGGRGRGGWQHLGTERETTTIFVGRSPYQVELTETIETSTERWVDTPSGSAPSGDTSSLSGGS